MKISRISYDPTFIVTNVATYVPVSANIANFINVRLVLHFIYFTFLFYFRKLYTFPNCVLLLSKHVATLVNV